MKPLPNIFLVFPLQMSLQDQLSKNLNSEVNGIVLNKLCWAFNIDWLNDLTPVLSQHLDIRKL